VSTGLAQQRQSSADFAIARYVARYPDAQDAARYTASFNAYAYDPTLGFMHWLTTGAREQRTAN
jgi:hypothetical protein